MDKEVEITATDEGLEFSEEDLTGEQLGEIINELADTYCTNPKCLNSTKPYRERDCEECRIFGTAHEVRKRLT
jgi:hypothetical protein